MRAVLVVAGVVAVLATGCGADGGPEPVAAVAPSTAASASPAPEPRMAGVRPTATPTKPAPARLTVPQARVRYLAVTRPYNVALERFEKAANDGASLSTLRKRARSVATANLTESRQLLAVAWPTSVSAQVRKLTLANAAARPHWLKVAAADSRSELEDHVRRAVAASDDSPAPDIRRLLGLPKYDEDDYS